jgi:hypothetical protein
MIDYKMELASIKKCIEVLSDYSPDNIKQMEILLNRYNDIIQNLYCLNKNYFQSTVDSLSDLEVEMNLFESDDTQMPLMKCLFEHYKSQFNFTLNIDINRYEHYKLIENIIYN